MKTAIIGMGDIYPIHIDALKRLNHIQLVAVCDIDEQKRNLVEDDVLFFTDYLEMLEQVELDCVHICLPHYLHYPVSKVVIEKGIHVFCEKPVALNLNEAKEFLKLEENHKDIKIGICLQNRYNETIEALKRIIDEKDQGKVLSIRARVPWFRGREYYDVKPWRKTMKEAGGGCMINQAVHTLDLMSYLVGDIESVNASICQLLDYQKEVEDTVSAKLYFKNQAQGIFWATLANDKNEDVSIAVDLENANFEIKDGILYKIDKSNTIEKICENQKLPGSKFYYGASHAKLIENFYDAILNGSDNYPHVQDAIESMKLIDAIRLSSDSQANRKL